MIIWVTFDEEFSTMDANIVARIKPFIPATTSMIKWYAMNPVTKETLSVTGNQGNILIE